MKAGAQDVAVFMAASEEFCQRNLNASIRESMDQFERMTAVAKKADIQIRGHALLEEPLFRK